MRFATKLHVSATIHSYALHSKSHRGQERANSAGDFERFALVHDMRHINVLGMQVHHHRAIGTDRNSSMPGFLNNGGHPAWRTTRHENEKSATFLNSPKGFTREITNPPLRINQGAIKVSGNQREITHAIGSKVERLRM
jgi:hypothetical protein